MNRHLIAVLLVAPLLAAVAPAAHADTVTRVTTTTTTNNCRDFTKTTNYVNRTVTTQGTACLFADGAWHDIGTPGNPVVEYDSPVVVERPVVYAEPAVVPVPVYGGGYYYDHPHHYGYGPGYYGRGGGDVSFSIGGRF